MHGVRLYLGVAGLGLALCFPASASHLVTGNGFGFAVVSPETASVTKFYPHPYSFERADPLKPLSEGIETPNFLKSLGWCGGDAKTSAEYQDDSHVIRMRCGASEGLVYMPFGLKRAALVVDWRSRDAGANGPQLEWNYAVKTSRAVRAAGVEMQLLAFKEVSASLLLVPLEPERGITAGARELLMGSSAWLLLPVDSEAEVESAAREFVAWRAGLTKAELAQREIADLERWRVKPTVHFANEEERHLWRQSETMLRIAQCREANRAGFYGNGLIVASLPDGVWFTPWVRDMAWATVALAKMGHPDEARAALLAYFNARPTGKMRAETAGADYQVSVVRYFGNGEEEPFFTEEGSTNIEFDDWGEVLWVLGEYSKKYGDGALLQTSTHRGKLYASARDFVVNPLLANMEAYGGGEIVAADTSIWEERQKDKKHFAFSTAMAIVGLREFAEIAKHEGDAKTKALIDEHLERLEKGFAAAFIRDGKLHGTLEEGVKNDVDGALLQIINFGVVTDPAVVRDVVKRMELLKVASGGYRRVRSTYTDPAIFEYWYERQEFVFVDLNLAEVERRLGREADAAAMLTRIVDKAAADHDIVPEMYVALPCKLFPGAIGDPTGALPMAGYGAGEYILHLLGRESAGTLQ